MKQKRLRVAIFGSARLKRSDPAYKEVYLLAKMIGERGFDVVTGGGPGLMQAANSGHKIGAKKNGSHSIGLNIRLPREQGFNKHLDIKREYNKFSSRLDAFMELSDVIVVASGGIGTLLELFYSWQLVQVGHISRLPIILMGDMWPGLVTWLKKEPLKRDLFDQHDLNMLIAAKDSKTTIKLIDKFHDEMFQKL